MKRPIAEGHIYHILTRGVDKRKIFMESGDYLRFTHNLFEFNNLNQINNNHYHYQRLTSLESDKSRSQNMRVREPRKLAVELFAFALMPNHYHLMIRARKKEAIPLFMKRVNMGYSRYFNEKYKREGTLFEGKYKLVPVNTEAHFIHLLYYIHFNPLDLKHKEWRMRALKNHRGALNFLRRYRWSSYLDYIGEKNFPSVTQRDFMLDFFGGTENYKKEARKWLKIITLEPINAFTLE